MTVVVQWVLDTRSLWPEAVKTSELVRVASRALDLLSDSERTGVLKYYHVKDAKLALGSALLKRLIIARYFSGQHGVTWSSATSTRDERTKPVFYMPPGSRTQPLRFNITHQAGLVALFAVKDAPAGTEIGVDIVCPGERRQRDLATLAGEGWPYYVDMHDSVFSLAEAVRLKGLSASTLLDGVASNGERQAQDLMDRRLAYFYALWCLREAYVKMTGEALLAKWLQDLDMRYFSPPGEQPCPEPASTGHREKGISVEGEEPLEIWFGQERVRDVEMRLTWLLGKEYMISTAVRRDTVKASSLDLGDFQMLEMEQVLKEAEALKAKERESNTFV